MEEKNPDIIAQLDQFSTHLENCASMIAVYYQKLIELGLPAHVAERLTSDFSLQFWAKVFLPPVRH